MSRFAIIIGNEIFSSKTAALKFYKQILDKYNFGESLSDYDAKHLIALSYKDMGTPEEVAEFAQDSISGFTFDNPNDVNIDHISSVMVERHPCISLVIR